MRRTSTVLWILPLLAALLATSGAQPASAQQVPNQQRGLSADTAYQVGDIDFVNLFNGGLTLRIPLGQTYPVGPNLSYGLSLSYSSNGWDYEELNWGQPPRSHAVSQFTYDRFGRLLQIDHPGGDPKRSLIRYRGEQRIDRSTSVATGDNGAENFVCSREEYDAFGG